MFSNIQKINFTIKIFLAILLALGITFMVGLLNKPKVNNIPILPQSIEVKLLQNSDFTLQLQSIDLSDKYPSDYQSGLTNNFYSIYLKTDQKVIFSGKIPKSYIIYEDDFRAATQEGKVEEKTLDNFTMYIPYYKEATEFIMVDDKGNQALDVDLTKQNLKLPQSVRRTCGDGICSDDENIISCYKDCL